MAVAGTALAVGDRPVPDSGTNPFTDARPKSIIFFLGDGMGT